MPDPTEESLQHLVARIGAGEAIDAEAIPLPLREHPRVRRLLALARVAGTLDRRIGAQPTVVDTRPGQLGPWRLLHLLGAGGMGEVWLGERSDDVVEQRVAIKRVRVHSRDVRERLLSERRLLARLEHPNIARFIDAGVDLHGSPWLVLEYVEGEVITDWCSRRELSLRARLHLFAKVCAAVGHAHRHLIVHRDLKPANVLVNADGEPKLLDFGIAKLLDGSDEGDSVAALTPSYAAPEQLRGGPVSTATDVYALGLLLFRLLAGALPRTRRGSGAAAVLACLDDEETQRPSACVEDDALPYPASALRGDLDAIVAQAMRARPESRYGSVAEFCADLERFLGARPVLAREPTRRYRLARFVRRNALAIGLVAVVIVTLMAGTMVSLQQARRAAREAQAAQRELARAETVSSFLASLYREQDPLNRAGPELLTPARSLAEAVHRVDSELGADEQSAARLLRVLGEAQFNLGDLRAARATLDLAVARASRANDALLGAEIDSLRAALALRELRQDEAERLFSSSLGTAVRLRGPESVEAARIEARQALSLVALGKFKEARSVANHAQQVLARELGADRSESITARITLGVIEEQLRDDPAALVTLDSAVASIESAFGKQDARLVTPLQTLGEVLRRTRDFARARAVMERAIEVARTHFGSRSAQLAVVLVRLAGVERDAGDLQRSLALLDEADRALPDSADDATRAQILNTRGSTWIELGNGARAEADYRKSLALRRKAGDPRSGLTWFTQAQVGTALALQGRYGEAQRLQAEAAREVQKLLGPDAYQNGLIAVRRAEAYEWQGDFANAVGQWREAVRLIALTYGREHFGHFDWSLQLAIDLARTADGQAEAARIADDLLERWTGNPQIAARYADLVLLRCRLHEQEGNPQEARLLARTALGQADLVAGASQRTQLERFAGR
ncbi:serine/threonine-protein kinase [Dokdonella immobilis]|uniref:Serine/threonine protein kinase n=1 Tax=Dokdonella immobilis TaxID=578942 RepID=A0A1I4YKJ8_9GAMM|nr:serine/threonine-protein kinase [Dokdonella immobilis]SFN38581.1 serine/threonine protein kinase [Dokdonella immobilis]